MVLVVAVVVRPMTANMQYKFNREGFTIALHTAQQNYLPSSALYDILKISLPVIFDLIGRLVTVVLVSVVALVGRFGVVFSPLVLVRGLVGVVVLVLVTLAAAVVVLEGRYGIF